MAQLSCENLTLGYEGQAILSGLSFSVSAGDYLCIVGENGSGKSTLMKAILGLQRPMAGTIVYGDGLLHNEIGYLPQQTPVQRDFPATVWEIVLSGRQGRSGRFFYSRKDKDIAMQNIEKMGIAALRERSYRDLSGGQQQRVLLARALSATRKLLLLDEPVAGLDPKVTGEMYEIIERLNRQEGITVIMISHDLDAAMDSATHVLHVDRENFFGTKAQYLHSAAARRLGLCPTEGGTRR